MHWRVKGALQKFLSAVPCGGHLHYLLQRRAGDLKDFDRELDTKVEAWRLMANQLRSVGIAIPHGRFLEIGSGWYPTFPICLYLGGAQSVHTVDLRRQMRRRLTLDCAIRIALRVPAIAKATGRDTRDVFEQQRALVRALLRGSSLERATGGVVRYSAPTDVGATDRAASSVDVVFSNSVLEHVQRPVIERSFAEARRILRSGGVIFHSANCGDHYAHVDSTINQLNYLRYSEAEWKKWNSAFLYQNRLRAIDFTTMARAAGFTIELDTSRPDPDRLAELAAIDVHPQFAHYSRDQLAITNFDFVGRKPARLAPD